MSSPPTLSEADGWQRGPSVPRPVVPRPCRYTRRPSGRKLEWISACVVGSQRDEYANDDRTLVTVDILAEPRAVSRAASGDLVENIELSRAALAEGNIQRIEEILAKNVTLPIRAAISLIRVLKKQRGLDAAVKQLHNEIAKHGEHPLLLEEIGRNYFSAGKTEEARRYFELAAAKDKAGYSGYYLAKMRAQT